MDREVFVYCDLAGAPHLMGRLWARVRKDKESATFEDAPGWLEHSSRFSLEPALALGPGPFHTAVDTPMFGAIGDSAPDRWGRVLMRRMERRRAERRADSARAGARMEGMRHRTRVVTWNGKDVPQELRDLPAGRYVVEAIEEEAPGMSPEEEAGVEAALESYRQGRVIDAKRAREIIDAALGR